VGIYLAARLAAASTLKGPLVGAIVTAAAATEGSNDSVRGVIITGIFGVVVALIGAGALLFRRTSRPDLSELLEVHERIAVMEANMADIREDLRAIRNIVGRDHDS